MKFSLKHFTNVIVQALSQGITPRKLAVTCALGVVIGIFPIFGTTTLFCLAVALIFRLNIPLIQLVNYLVAPLQLILILPFIRMGTYVFRLNPFPYTAEELTSMFRNDFWFLLKETGMALVIGIGVWVVISVPLFFLLFYLSLWFISRWRTARQREL
jgi:uncharacterized protein (DUF2062 family)